MILNRYRLCLSIALCFGLNFHSPAHAEGMDIENPRSAKHVASMGHTAQAASLPRRNRALVFASTLKPGCKPTSHIGSVAMVVGAQSRCLGGSLTKAETEMAAFENRTAQNDPAASLALRQDPRRITRVPLAASAGFALPLSAYAQIGVEYSFSQHAELSPFHFRNGGGFADETAGHSARFHVGLKL